MRLQITEVNGAKCYVAKLRGLDPRYKFDREFLERTTRPLRVKKGHPQRTQYTYQISDGLYEVCESSSRKYLAVVNNRRIPLDYSDLQAVADLCKESPFPLTRVFDLWVASSKRSSESFRETAVRSTASILAEREAKRRAIQQRERERQKKRRAIQKHEREQRKKRVQTMTSNQVFEGAVAADTRAFLKRLEQLGAEGRLAAELFRCLKASTRAKMYRGEYRDIAYDRKSASHATVVRRAPDHTPEEMGLES